MSDIIEVVTTAASQEDAQRIAETLIQQRLAACAQVFGPVTSTFHWQGAIEKSQEWRCTLKTRGDLYAQVEQAIQAVHPYDEPEILAFPVARGSDGYLRWVVAETTES